LKTVPELQPFYGYRPDMAGFAEFLKNKKVVADREVLVRVLTRQYEVFRTKGAR
jgi:hypothetical protein